MFGYNCSNLMFHLSSALSNSDLIHPGDNIVVSPACHDANVASWLWLARNAGARTRYLPLMDENNSEEADKIDAEQLKSVIDEKTREENHKDLWEWKIFTFFEDSFCWERVVYCGYFRGTQHSNLILVKSYA